MSAFCLFRFSYEPLKIYSVNLCRHKPPLERKGKEWLIQAITGPNHECIREQQFGPYAEHLKNDNQFKNHWSVLQWLNSCLIMPEDSV